MKRLLKYVFVLAIGVGFVSCHRDSDSPTFPIRDYAEQYATDKVDIDKYLDENYMTVNSSTYEVTFAKIPSPNPTNIQSIRQQTTYPLLNKTVSKDGVDYKVYYINFREGLGDRPNNVDSVFVSYKGVLLDNTEFDRAQTPSWFTLDGVVPGWKEMFPLFKSSDSHVVNTDGTVTFNNYGAGVLFLPSGLGYYYRSVGVIPAYSPLIFNFGLKGVNYVDHDGDRIDSRYEDINGNGIFTDDDTDGDGRPNYLDADDDGDGYLTKYEIKRPDVGGVANGYYPYNGAATDDSSTPNIDETQGIPSRSGVAPSYTYDYTTPTRLRKHVDPSWH